MMGSPNRAAFLAGWLVGPALMGTCGLLATGFYLLLIGPAVWAIIAWDLLETAKARKLLIMGLGANALAGGISNLFFTDGNLVSMRGIMFIIFPAVMVSMFLMFRVYSAERGVEK